MMDRRVLGMGREAAPEDHKHQRAGKGCGSGMRRKEPERPRVMGNGPSSGDRKDGDTADRGKQCLLGVRFFLRLLPLHTHTRCSLPSLTHISVMYACRNTA